MFVFILALLIVWPIAEIYLMVVVSQAIGFFWMLTLIFLSAVVGMLSVLLIPLVHWSVVIWRSLHQEASVLNTDGDIRMDGLMLFTLFVGVAAFSLLYLWLMLHRTRAMAMEDLLEDRRLDIALAERRAEGGAR